MFKAPPLCNQPILRQWLAMAAVVFSIMLPGTSRADLRTPPWYNNNTGGPASDWHYRVPVAIPAGTALNATIKLDVDFAALIAQLGLSDTLQANSPRGQGSPRLGSDGTADLSTAQRAMPLSE